MGLLEMHVVRGCICMNVQSDEQHEMC